MGKFILKQQQEQQQIKTKKINFFHTALDSLKKIFKKSELLF